MLEGPLQLSSEFERRLAAGACIACRLRGAVRKRLGETRLLLSPELCRWAHCQQLHEPLYLDSGLWRCQHALLAGCMSATCNRLTEAHSALLIQLGAA